MSFKRHKADKNLNILKDMQHTERAFDKTVIRFDGVYNSYDTAVAPCGQRWFELHFLDKFFAFYKNGMMLRSAYVFRDSSSSADYFKRFVQDYNMAEAGQVGVFNINKDTIDIVCYDSYGVDNGHIDNFVTHFKGRIKNADTIIDLKIVAPYPDIKPKPTGKLMRGFYLEAVNKTYMLVFKPFPAKTFVDSNNFWINKYK